jgi:hypothetical protein
VTRFSLEAIAPIAHEGAEDRSLVGSSLHRREAPAAAILPASTCRPPRSESSDDPVGLCSPSTRAVGLDRPFHSRGGSPAGWSSSRTKAHVDGRVRHERRRDLAATGRGRRCSRRCGRGRRSRRPARSRARDPAFGRRSSFRRKAFAAQRATAGDERDLASPSQRPEDSDRDELIRENPFDTPATKRRTFKVAPPRERAGVRRALTSLCAGPRHRG